MIIGVLKEPPFENRVSLLPETIISLVKKGIKIYLEPDAGIRSFCPDEDYLKNGALIQSREEIISSADILLSINSPQPILPTPVRTISLIGNYQPLFHPDLMKKWAEQGISTFSLDMLPRTTRAQSMDILSSQANIAGYKAVLLAAGLLPHYMPMFMTAAGSIPPAKVLVLGAGVAGLQAVATARRLGAVVEVFDTRPAVKEEVMSLGAKFIEVEGAADASRAGGYAVEQGIDFLERQKARIAQSASKSDIIITTAQIPGKQAPKLLSTEMIESMKRGSVIIDIAAATGGNTDLTQNNTTIEHHGIRIVGDSFLPSSMPYDASKLYGKNVLNFLQIILDSDLGLKIDFADDLVKGTCITYGGKVIHERVLGNAG